MDQTTRSKPHEVKSRNKQKLIYCCLRQRKQFFRANNSAVQATGSILPTYGSLLNHSKQ